MKWITEPPTEPGWYWARNHHDTSDDGVGQPMQIYNLVQRYEHEPDKGFWVAAYGHHDYKDLLEDTVFKDWQWWSEPIKEPPGWDRFTTDDINRDEEEPPESDNAGD